MLKGDETKIDWMESFNSYKQLLISKADEPEVIALFNHLDRMVFGLQPQRSLPLTTSNTVDRSLAHLNQLFERPGPADFNFDNDK